MANVITQETFDEAVNENIIEFEMTPEEAIKEAEDQFKAQGVNLSNIIQDMILHTKLQGDGNKQKHPINAAIEVLKTELDKQPEDNHSLCFNVDIVLNEFSKLLSECQIDLAHRCLASKEGAMNILHQFLVTILDLRRKSLMDNLVNGKLLKSLLNLMTYFMIGQPDCIRSTQLSYLVSLIQEEPRILDWSEFSLLFGFIRQTCLLHEANRQYLVDKGFIEPLVQLLDESGQAKQGQVLRDCCVALRSLTLDDDVRVPFGRAHEHAKLIVAETPVLQLLLKLCQTYTEEEDHSTVSEIFTTLNLLSVRNEFCQSVLDLGGVDFILGALSNHSSFQNIAQSSLGVVKSLSGNDNVKISVGKCGGIPILIQAIEQHINNEPVCFNGFSALASVCLRQPDNSRAFMNAIGLPTAIQAIKIHKSNANVVRQICILIRNIVAHCPDLIPTILDNGLETLLNEIALSKCPDEAKSALRDLGCKVHLRELWTGEKGHIPM